VADRLRAMLDAFEAGEVERARAINATMLPVVRAMGRTGGAVFSKTALRLRGIDVGGTRLPLPPATDEQVAGIAADLAEAGVTLDARGTLGSPAPADLGAEVAYR
jgi:4-hydroxy-tetrahydrodipicolinate synthase